VAILSVFLVVSVIVFVLQRGPRSMLNVRVQDAHKTVDD